MSLFDSSDYQDQEDTAGEVDYFLGRRRRRQTQVRYSAVLHCTICTVMLYCTICTVMLYCNVCKDLVDTVGGRRRSRQA